ncbi:hypothetical protein TKK_0009339 [Trichogramma kaykai]|uniref:phospholipase A1 n=1 Tax=Trichogramma kaykai TaxID=54128 RepID=A0ABD2X3L7_9HYME
MRGVALIVCFIVISNLRPGYHVLADNEDIACPEFKSIPLVGPLLLLTSSRSPQKSPVTFYLSTVKERSAVRVKEPNWPLLIRTGFDFSKKLYIVVHGYMGKSHDEWILDLKNKLLELGDGNVFLVDWKAGSNDINYVNSARNTEVASAAIFNFLDSLKKVINERTVDKTNWRGVYFIGHSLGAQVSAQAAHLLKEDRFWTVDRITGLDPAKPCFTRTNLQWKIDKGDANFVDIIHTQAGEDNKGINSLGLKESLGHVDFYVNGGVIQPNCANLFLAPMLIQMGCSHKLSHIYFAESITNSIKGNCKFASYPWDGSYEDAIIAFKKRKTGEFCSDCPEMGINASKSTKRGNFIVITAAESPYCGFSDKDQVPIMQVLGQLMDAPPLGK